MHNSNNTYSIFGWLFLISAILFSSIVRYRLQDIPLERDEGEYAYAGVLLQEGVPPYKLAYNMKLPGTYVAYAGLMSIFGPTVHGVRFGMLAVHLACIAMVFVLTRDIFDNYTAGGASLIYAILSLSEASDGTFAHATHFVGLFGLAGTICLYRHCRCDSAFTALLSGLLFGTAFLMKQQGMFLMLFGGVTMAVHLVCSGRAGRLGRLLQTFLYCVSALIPYLSICWWLWSAGVWEKFRFWTIDYAAQYANADIVEHIAMGIVRSLELIKWHPFVFLLALMGIVATTSRWGLSAKSHPEQSDSKACPDRPHVPWGTRSAFVCGYLLFSALCVIPGRWSSHYFLVVFPSISILAAVGCLSDEAGVERKLILRRFQHWWNSGGASIETLENRTAINDCEALRTGEEPNRSASVTARHLFLSLLILGFVVTASIYCERRFFFWAPPLQLCREIFGRNPFLESKRIAAFLEGRVASTETIAVLGSEPQLMFLSRRRSCTGYIYMYPLMENQPFARQMQQELITEIEKGAPAVIVDVQVKASWLKQNNIDLVANWKRMYLEKYYRRVGLVDITLNNGTEFRFDDEVDGQMPKSDAFVTIYQRN